MPPTETHEIPAVTFARFEGKLDQVIHDHSRRLGVLEDQSRAAGGKVMGWIGVGVSLVAVGISTFR